MLDLIKKYESIIQSYKVEKFEQFGTNLRLRMEIEFKNNSTLYIRETIIENSIRKYSYHWQDNDANLLVRWDNAPDWDIKTFPHHKHYKEQILPSYERTLEQVLKVIKAEIEGEKIKKK